MSFIHDPSVDELLQCLCSGSVEHPHVLWRIPLTENSAHSGLVGGVGHVDAASADHDAKHLTFCLHLQTESSVAGAMCVACGMVVSTINQAGEGRGPVAVRVATDEKAPELILEQARHEWDQQIGKVVDQPREVLQHAWLIFEQVYRCHGSVSGTKARALVLVSLLYSSRLLHGSNGGNEAYLLRTLSTPTRVMNKAFTQMAAVALPLTVSNSSV